MSNAVLFTPTSGASPRGVDTGVVGTTGTVNSGTLLPVGAAAHWSIFVTSAGVVSLKLDSILQQTSISNILIEDTELDSNIATFGTAGAISTWTWIGHVSLYNTFGVGSPVNASLTVAPPDTSFNCDCESASPYDTLLNVRRKMLIRLGYPNQLTNPPPGMATLVDQFLRDAQAEVYMQLQRAALRTERFFKWTMVPGQRYYAFASEEESCQTLNPYKVTWVGFEDLNQAWYRLDEGIPPEYYTRANINFGWPTRFELRSCVEIFPAPQAAYTLWIKGDFGLGALVADADRFTIDDMAVYLLALGNAKAHYGQKDAQLVLSQAANYSKSLVAGSHGTKRYVPQAGTANPLTPPRFLPLGNDQA